MNIIKRLALMAFAVLALTALVNVTSASASPSGFLADEYKWGPTVKGTSEYGEAGENYLSVFGFNYVCKPPWFTTSQKAPSTTVVPEPAKSDGSGTCYDNGGELRTLKMNGCYFTLDPGGESYSNAFGGKIGITPPGCGPIETDLLYGKCHISITPNTGFTSSNTTYKNEGSGTGQKIKVNGQLQSLDYTKSGTGCGSGSGEASYTPAWKVTAENVANEPMGIKVVPELPFGLYLSGAGKGFEAESYPLSVGATGFTFTGAGLTFACEEATLADSITAATKQLTMDPTHGKCTVAGFKFEVVMNSCYYTLTDAGAFTIACSKEGDKTEYKAYDAESKLFCTYKVGPQSSTGSFSLANVGAGTNRGVSVSGEVTGIQWERSGTKPVLCPTGSGTNGAMKGPTTLGEASPPPDSVIFSGPSGTVDQATPDVSFTFAATDSAANPPESGATLQCSFDGAAYTACTSPMEYKGIAEGAHTFKVRSAFSPGNVDKTPAERSFTLIDSPETTITSPKPSYMNNETWPVTFTSEESGVTYKCSLDDPEEKAKTTCTSPYALPSNPNLTPGWHTFVVAATDKDGHADATPAKWIFNTAIYPAAPTTSKLISPEEGRITASYYTLKAEWGSAPSGGGVTGVTFQVMLPGWAAFQVVPAKCVIDGKGQQVSWPLATTSNPGHTEPVFLKVSGCEPFAITGYPEFPEEPIKFRAIFDGGVNAAGASEPVTTEFSGEWGSPTDAVQQVGPAMVDLVTGQFSIKRVDVSIPIPGTEANLEFARTYESAFVGQGGAALGGMWQPSGPMEQAYPGEAWRRLQKRHQDFVPAEYDEECEEEGYSHEECLVEEAIPAADWVELLDNEGNAATFEYEGGKYITPDYLPEFVLTEQSETFELGDPDGVHTTFIKDQAAGAIAAYVPKSISWQGTNKSARMVYEYIKDAKGTQFFVLGQMIAPAPAGVTCSDTEAYKTAGCRSLDFQYTLCECEGWTRLASITYYNASGNPETSKEVAKYEYDKDYRLIAEWDPRISPSLKEKYTYGTFCGLSCRDMRSLTPPGEEPWEFDYYEGSEFSKEGENYRHEDGELFGRLKSVSRATLLKSGPSTATTTITYQVKRSGEGAPYDMSPTAVAKWGQADYPVDATAIFPPTQVPSSPRPTDFSQATVHYMDPDGYEVNMASPQLPGASGPSISTSEIDPKGNLVRSLGSQNRLTAVAAADTVAKSKELDAHSVYEYGEAGAKLLKSQSWGPLHKVGLESGETVEARQHTTVEFDQLFTPTEAETKSGVAWPGLPTKEITAAAIAGKADQEARVTETKYAWDLRKPIEAISGNVVMKAVYNSAGQIKERSQPSDTEGKTAGTIKTVYWTAGANAEQASCGNSKPKAGLPCVSYPVADPSPAEGNPKVAWTWYTKYSNLDQPEEVQEKTNGVLKRTTTITYDSAGRPLKTKQTGEGTSVPTVETTYSSETGAPVGQHFVCEPPESCTGFDSQAVTATFDKLGRLVYYEDADAGTSSFGYDLEGRPVLSSDGKGTQVITYDEKTGAVTKLVDSAAGTFTASYNADAQMTEQVLPNGLAAQTGYDPDGNAISLRYQKLTNCSVACTWFEFGQELSIRGQVLKQTGSLATTAYGYDSLGRLTLAKETPTGEGCTTRSYAYDNDSNRTSLTTRAPGKEGACDTSSEGTKKSYNYDTADRLIGSGVTYDNLGRITSLPSTYSGGGTLTTNYYVDNLVRLQTQDGLTNTYYLDAALRQREVVQSGAKSGTAVLHYATPSDSPAWVQEGSAWSRNIGALGGGLGAIQKSSGETTLQLANLHGDVIATASLDPYATKTLSTQRFDEFGNPKQSNTAKYGWLGSKGRRTELASGVVQMGVRSYVPSLGRFLSPDPVNGGSASAYDYGNADPVNQLDLGGTDAATEDDGTNCHAKVHIFSFKRKKRMHMNLRVHCAGGKTITVHILKARITYEKAQDGCFPHHFCKGPYCHAEDDCEDVTLHEENISTPRHWGAIESLPCEPGVEYQVTINIDYHIGSVIVVGSGKGGNGEPGAVGGGHDEALNLQVQQYCSHSNRGET